MALLSPGDDRYKALALLKKSRYKLVTLVVDVAARQQRVARHFRQPPGLSEVDLLEGIARLANALKGLTHPNLPRFDKVVEGEGGTWMMADFEPGVALSQYIGAESTVPLAWVLWWLHEIAVALAALHGLTPPCCVGHLEPSDVVVREHRLFLVDLGFFEQIYPDPAPQELHPYAHFMAPEKRAGATPATVSADLFSAGALAFWLLTGYAPVVAPGGRAVLQEALHGYCPDLPDPVTELVCQMLDFDAKQRPASADEARHRLAPYVASMRGQPLPSPSIDPELLPAAEVTRRMAEVEPPAPLPRRAMAAPAPPPSPPVPPPRLAPAVAAAGLLVVGAGLFALLRTPLHGGPSPAQPSHDLMVVSGELYAPQSASSSAPWPPATPVPTSTLVQARSPVQLQFGRSSLWLDPKSTLQASPGSGDGALTLHLASGMLHVHTAAETVEVDLPQDNILAIPPGCDATVDLTVEDGTGGAVSCRVGMVTLAWHSQTQTLAAGSQVSLHGAH